MTFQSIFYTEAVEKPIFHTKQSLMTSKTSIFIRTQMKKEVLLILLLHDMHVVRKNLSFSVVNRL